MPAKSSGWWKDDAGDSVSFVRFNTQNSIRRVIGGYIGKEDTLGGADIHNITLCEGNI
jgi:hypothetical protein